MLTGKGHTANKTKIKITHCDISLVKWYHNEYKNKPHSYINIYW